MKILLLQTAFLGDLVLTTALIREIKKKYPDSELTVVVNLGTEDILIGNPNISQVLTLYKKMARKSLRYFLHFASELRQRKFDLCISPHFSFRSSILSFLSRAPKRIGYSSSGFSFLHTKTVKRPLRGPHEVDKLYSLIYNRDEYPDNFRPEIYLPKNQIADIKKLLNDLSIDSGGYIVVAPSSVWETKRMPLEKFREVVSELRHKTDRRIVFIGSLKDRELCDQICGEDDLNLAGATNLLELAYVISKASVIISNDSSPIHFASAFNVPTIAIFGATIPAFGYTPLSDKHWISEVDGLPCRPCGIHGGNRCPQKHFKCMLEQDTHKIAAKAIQFIEDSQ